MIRARTPAALLASLALLAAAGGPAAAAGGKKDAAAAGKPAAGKAPPAPPPAKPPADAAAGPTTAKEWFAKASAHHKAGEYDEAIAAYKEAHRVDPHPVYLYDIALVNRLKGAHAEALRYYEKFLEDDPGSSLRPEAEKRIAELKKLIAAAEAARSGASSGAGATGTGAGKGGKAGSAVVLAPAGPVAPGSPALAAAGPVAPPSSGAGLAVGLAFGGGAIIAGAAVVLVVLFTSKSPVDRAIDDYPGTVIDHRGAE